MKNNLIMLSVILIMISITLVSAEQYPINQPIEFSKPCVDAGNAPCVTTTQCYISLKYKNGPMILSNRTMTYIYPYANYTLPAQSELRDYTATINCFSGGVNGTQDYDFKVNVSGDNRDNYAVLLILGLFAILIFAFGFYNNSIWLVYISGVMFLVLGVYDLINGFNNFRDVYTDTIGYVSIGLAVIFFVIGAYEQFVDDDGE